MIQSMKNLNMLEYMHGGYSAMTRVRNVNGAR